MTLSLYLAALPPQGLRYDNAAEPTKLRRLSFNYVGAPDGWKRRAAQ